MYGYVIYNKFCFCLQSFHNLQQRSTTPNTQGIDSGVSTIKFRNNIYIYIYKYSKKYLDNVSQNYPRLSITITYRIRFSFKNIQITQKKSRKVRNSQ